MLDVMVLAQQCAPAVHPQTMAAIVKVESGGNPFAIGVVGGRLERQPANEAEAIATAQALKEEGFNFSLGIAQVNRYNLGRFGLDLTKAFDACSNLRAGSEILRDCFESAKARFSEPGAALRASFSCYYSGNLSTGFKQTSPGQPSYVDKVWIASGGQLPQADQAIPVVRTPTVKLTRSQPNSQPLPAGHGVPLASGVTPSGDPVVHLFREGDKPREQRESTSVYGADQHDSVMVY